MFRFRILVIAFLFTIVGNFSAQETTACNADNPVLFGFVVDNSAGGAIFADSQFKGIDFAMEDLNASGGILGRCAEYIWQDAELDPSKGATIAEQFVLVDEVDFLIGPTSSSVALAITEIARENQIPIAFHTSNSVQLSTTSFHPYMVQVAPNTIIEGQIVAQYASELGLLDWGIIGPDYSYGRDLVAGFQQNLLEIDASVNFITEQWPPLSERDLNPFVTALETLAPEAIFTSLWGDQLVNFISAADEFGLLEDLTLFGLMDTDVLKAMGEDLPEGLYGFSRAPFYAIDTEQMADFNERYFAAYDEYPSDWAILAYDSVMALASAAEAASSVEGDPVAAALDDLTFRSLRGDLTVRACDHMTNAGDYIGVTTQESEYGIPILTDVVFVPADQVWASCGEIEALREAATNN